MKNAKQPLRAMSFLVTKNGLVYLKARHMIQLSQQVVFSKKQGSFWDIFKLGLGLIVV